MVWEGVWPRAESHRLVTMSGTAPGRAAKLGTGSRDGRSAILSNRRRVRSLLSQPCTQGARYSVGVGADHYRLRP
jgi:hypothetical protein